MSKETREDLKDIQEVAKQKREQCLLNEKMGTWHLGQGIKKEKDVKENVRGKIQQKSRESL